MIGTAYSSPVGAALDVGRALLFLGLEIPSMNRGSGTGGLCFLAMTFGTVTGVTSDALPMRRYRDPGCMTMTLDPRRAYNTYIVQNSGFNSEPTSPTDGPGSSWTILFLAAAVARTALRYQ